MLRVLEGKVDLESQALVAGLKEELAGDEAGVLADDSVGLEYLSSYFLSVLRGFLWWKAYWSSM